MSLTAYLDYNRLRADMKAQDDVLGSLRKRVTDQHRLLRSAYPYLMALQSDAARLDDEFRTDASGEWLDRIRGLCQRVSMELENKP